jgi:hypothetical protein
MMNTNIDPHAFAASEFVVRPVRKMAGRGTRAAGNVYN